MGVLTNCCARQNIIQSSSISIYSLTEEDNLKPNNICNNEIPTNLDINNAFKFITSKEYYSLLIKNIPKHNISKKICAKIKNEEIIALINNIYEWIKKQEFEQIDENTKKIINVIRANTKISLNYILNEIKSYKFIDKKEIFIIQALNCISLIVQIILFIANNKNKNSNGFNINIWENKNIIDEAKIYAFQTAYFLLLIKKKYRSQKSNQKEENKITNEKKEEVNSFYRTSIIYTSDIMNL